VEEVSQQVVPCFGEYGFGVYLGSFNYVVFVPQPHYLPFLGSSSDLEAGGQRFRFDNQLMIAGCRERVLYAMIDSFAIMVDERSLTMCWYRGSSHNAAIDVTDALVPQADA